MSLSPAERRRCRRPPGSSRGSPAPRSSRSSWSSCAYASGCASGGPYRSRAPSHGQLAQPAHLGVPGRHRVRRAAAARPGAGRRRVRAPNSAACATAPGYAANRRRHLRAAAQVGGGRRRAASRRSRPGCAGPGPRPARWPAGAGPGWRSARCWWPPSAARPRRPARRARRCGRRRRGAPWSVSSTATVSAPNSAVSRSSSRAAASTPLGEQRRRHVPLAAAGQHQHVVAQLGGDLLQVAVDRAALLPAGAAGPGR